MIENGKNHRYKLDVVNEEWTKDSELDVSDLMKEEEKQVQLHSKYQTMLSRERRTLRHMQVNAERFRFNLLKFYRDGATDKEQLEYAKSHGWEIPPSGKPHVKTDLKHWVDTNPEMVDIMLELAEQQDLVETLQDILEQIKGRGFSVNAAIKLKIHNDGG